MSNGRSPTQEQKEWLARVFGKETWEELCTLPEFCVALSDSLPAARRIGLKHLAAKELSVPAKPGSLR